MANHKQTAPSPFADRAVSYLEVPAIDIAQSSKFYRQVFGWVVSSDGEQGRFTDGSGHVIGHWRTDLEVAGDRGVRPYIYVSDLDQVLNDVAAHGGTIVQPRYIEGDLWVARFRDPPATSLASGSKSLHLRRPQLSSRKLHFQGSVFLLVVRIHVRGRKAVVPQLGPATICLVNLGPWRTLNITTEQQQILARKATAHQDAPEGTCVTPEADELPDSGDPEADRVAQRWAAGKPSGRWVTYVPYDPSFEMPDEGGVASTDA